VSAKASTFGNDSAAARYGEGLVDFYPY